MFTLFRSIRMRQWFSEQLPALAIAMSVAELFYKFHSFLLECGAFLVTWFVVDASIQGFVWLASRRKALNEKPA